MTCLEIVLKIHNLKNHIYHLDTIHVATFSYSYNPVNISWQNSNITHHSLLTKIKSIEG